MTLVSARYTCITHSNQRITMNLLPQSRKPKELNEKQQLFLDNLFENGGNLRQAAEDAGYNPKSTTYLRNALADEIIERSKSLMAGHAVKAVNRLVATIDDDGSEPRAEIRLKAAEALLNRIGLGKQETINHNVQAVHGVVLLPPKGEINPNG
jgi:hypothetical protein